MQCIGIYVDKFLEFKLIYNNYSYSNIYFFKKFKSRLASPTDCNSWARFMIYISVYETNY